MDKYYANGHHLLILTLSFPVLKATLLVLRNELHPVFHSHFVCNFLGCVKSFV